MSSATPDLLAAHGNKVFDTGYAVGYDALIVLGSPIFMSNSKVLELPVPRETLGRTVTARLRDLVLHGDLLPGTRLQERRLCEQLHVSRTPLREAIKTLSSEGLVEFVRSGGARVTYLSADDVAQTFEVLAHLEGLAGELAAERIDAASEAELQARHYEMLAAFARQDLSAYYEANAAIHDGIYVATRNVVLAEECRRLNARTRRLRYSLTLTAERWRQSLDEHEQIMAALKARDAVALRAILETHLRGKKEVVLAALNEARAEENAQSPSR